MALSYAPARMVSFESGTPASATANSIATGDFAASDLSPMSALVVPAKMEIGRGRAASELRRSVPVAAKSVDKRSLKRARQPDAVPASAVQRLVKAPRLLRTSSPTRGGVPQTLVFVTQTEVVQTEGLRAEFVQSRQYDASGVVVWNLCVWRVTMVAPEPNMQNKMPAGIAAKSI
jgi:hypothetical protein